MITNTMCYLRQIEEFKVIASVSNRVIDFVII